MVYAHSREASWIGPHKETGLCSEQVGSPGAYKRGPEDSAVEQCKDCYPDGIQIPDTGDYIKVVSWPEAY